MTRYELLGQPSSGSLLDSDETNTASLSFFEDLCSEVTRVARAPFIAEWRKVAELCTDTPGPTDDEGSREQYWVDAVGKIAAFESRGHLGAPDALRIVAVAQPEVDASQDIFCVMEPKRKVIGVVDFGAKLSEMPRRKPFLKL